MRDSVGSTTSFFHTSMVVHPRSDDHLRIRKFIHKGLLSLLSKEQQNGKVSLNNAALGFDYKLSINMLTKQLFISLSAQKCLCMYGGDARDAYAHAPAPGMMTHLTIDDAYFKWYKEKTGKILNRRFVLPILHSLQGHPESGKIWTKLIDQIFIKDLSFATTTKDYCI